MLNAGDPPIIVEQEYAAPVAALWKCLTDVKIMRQWFFDNIPSFRPEAGFKTRFDVSSGDRIFPHEWRVVDLIPEKMLKVNWQYTGYEGDSNVIFELSEQPSGTLLRVTNEILASFPEDIPEFTRDSCFAGWTYLLKDRLKAYIERNF